MNAGGLRPQPLRSPIACMRSRAQGHGPDGPKAILAAPLSLAAAKIARRFSPMSFPLAASRAAAVFDIDRPAAAVFVVDPAAGLGSQIERFAARFGLTPAETRVLGGNHWRQRPSRRRCEAQNYRGDGAHPHEPHSCENRNHPSDGAHPPVLRDRIARFAGERLNFQQK